MPERILVVDGDPATLRFVEVNLRLEGYAVDTASDGEQALAMVRAHPPDLVVLDVMIPGIDGLEVTRRLRADGVAAHVPIIILTAKSMTGDKVVGLAAGADDYVLKPFDPLELIARVRTTLRRTSELRATSPLTGMPGNHRIDRELAGRLDEGRDLALVYADLNDFKTFNDRYGFLHGDEVITLTARVIREAAAAVGDPDAFAGHIGGDDFMILVHPDRVAALCEAIIADFDRSVPALYDPEDAARGYLEITDRVGRVLRSPIVSIAMGVASTERRRFHDHREMVQVATEMKSFVKHTYPGSAYAIDSRRTPEGDGQRPDGHPDGGDVGPAPATGGPAAGFVGPRP